MNVHRPSPLLRLFAGSTPFTIVSNNCWGAHVYKVLGIPYATPFVGLFVPPGDYLRLLTDFDRLMGEELTFVPESGSAQINEWRAREGLGYPIARLGGAVEINFQHYSNEFEVRHKWARRRARMTSRRFFKFDDRNEASCLDIAAFIALPHARKVCFTALPHAGTVLAPAQPGTSHVVDGVALAAVSWRHFNTLRWISTAPEWLPVPSLI